MAAARAVSRQAVHIKLHPRPANISESREVLRILQSYGEVVMFKSLRYDYFKRAPNSILAIYRDAESASKLLRASPLRFTLEPIPESEVAHEIDVDAEVDDALDETPGPHVKPTNRNAEEMTRPSTLLNNAPTTADWGSFGQNTQSPSPHSRAAAPFEEPPPSLRPSPRSSTASPAPSSSSSSSTTNPSAPTTTSAPLLREFHLSADVSLLNHRDAIAQGPYYGGFPIAKSAVQQDLARSVPTQGLSEVNMRKERPPRRIVARRARELEEWRRLRWLLESGEGGGRDEGVEGGIEGGGGKERSEGNNGEDMTERAMMNGERTTEDSLQDIRQPGTWMS